LEQKSVTQERGKVDLLFTLTPHEADRAKRKRELIRRLTRIERLAKQKDYAEIEELLNRTTFDTASLSSVLKG